MNDVEKVIAALNCRAYDDDFPCWKCAYYKQDEKPVARCDYRGLMDDAIALLKEQQPKTGHWIQSKPKFESARSNGGSRISTCSNCGGWGRKSFEYCPHCGAKMEGW